MTFLDFVPALAIITPVTTSVIGWVSNRHTKIDDELSDHDKRIALCERSFTDLKELINTRFDDQSSRLGRIERKVLNGGYLEYDREQTNHR